MNAVTITRDETLELRLKALRLPSILEQYVELAERAAAWWFTTATAAMKKNYC